MIQTLERLLEDHRDALYLFFRRLRSHKDGLLAAPAFSREYDSFTETEAGESLRETDMGDVVTHTHEVVVVDPPMLFLAIRPHVARWHHVQIHMEEMRCREVTVSEFLAAKERLALEAGGADRYALEIDLAPFERGFPKPSRPTWIGRGVEYLNRFLSSRLFEEGGEGRQRLFEFLRVHNVRGQQLMLNGVIANAEELRQGLREAGRILRRADGDDWRRELRKIGFAPGWGDTPERALETMELLLDVLDAPSPDQLEEFLARIPMITSIAIISPHGYFGQSGVLGKPDTGGQVVYILDQVRALEQAMRRSLRRQGLDVEPHIVVLTRLIPDAEDTTCDERIEPIVGTENARILRVPFRTAAGEIVRPWISRFDIWPYVERYAVEAERELLAELGSRPDFIIGNYSDGNLVASIMAHRLDVTQCNIAHALEKTKYPGSDLRWQAHEDQYHFSCQYTADLIAMNTADFIITSTYQEIAGTEESLGQYESYGAYTMPGLYRVVSGIDCFDPKFNIVSPGADPQVFFPHWDEERRSEVLRQEIRELVYGDPPDAYRGTFADPDKPLVFAMSRLDRVKNMAGLLEWFALNDELRQRTNLLLVGGWLDPELSTDHDERRQIEITHNLLDEYELDGHVRWIEMQTDKNRVGELYRLVADSRGAFVQPAYFEAFGLTVIEAMNSGLPVFATRYGGPLESIENDRSGYHVDPVRPNEAAEVITDFFRRTEEDPGEWDRIARAAVARTEERYNWPLYAATLLKLSRIYGFWKYITTLERDETRRYLEMFYGLMYRPLAKKLEENRA